MERFEEAKADEADDLLDDLEFNPSDAAPRVGHLSGRYDMILYGMICCDTIRYDMISYNMICYMI